MALDTWSNLAVVVAGSKGMAGSGKHKVADADELDWMVLADD